MRKDAKTNVSKYIIQIGDDNGGLDCRYGWVLLIQLNLSEKDYAIPRYRSGKRVKDRSQESEAMDTIQ